MRSQRGSVALIAIVFMLFLTIIGVAWLPLLNTEAQQARVDSDEQLAWYAAEAGYKYAYAGLKNGAAADYWTAAKGIDVSEHANDPDLLANKWRISAANSEPAVTYAVGVTGIMPSGSKAAIEAGEHIITSVGQCNGVTRVITERITTTGDGSGSGGGSGEGDENPELPNVLVAAGGSVTVNSNQHINQDSDIKNEFGGNLYGSEIKDITSGEAFTNKYTQGQYPQVLKTKIPDSIFQQKNYSNLETMKSDKTSDKYFGSSYQDRCILVQGKDYLWKASEVTGRALTLDARQASGRTVFIDNSTKNDAFNFSNIYGPASGEPVTFVFSSPQTVTIEATFSGRIRMLFAGAVNFGYNAQSYATNGLTMLLANGDMSIIGSISPGFLSANGNVKIERISVFRGQIQCKGNFSTTGNGAIEYDPSVFQDTYFTVPKGMTAG